MGWVALDMNQDGITDGYMLDADNDGRGEQFWFDTNGTDRDYEVVVYDQDENGLIEWAVVDQDNNGHFDSYYNDYDRDGRPGDYVLRDRNADGRFEQREWDSNEDGRIEWIAVDLTGDGYADGWSQTTTATRPTVYDQWAQNFIAASNNRLAAIWLQ